MRPPELAVGRGACAAALVGSRDFRGCLDALEDHLPRLGAAVVGLHLVRAQVVDERAVIHAVVGDGARGVEPHRLEVFGDELHRRDAAGGYFLDERLDRGEGRAAPPEAEAGCVGEVRDLGGAGRARVDDPGIRQPVLQLDDGESAPRRLADASAALRVERGRRAMRLVEDDDALEALLGGRRAGGVLSPTREPGDDLLHAVHARRPADTSRVLSGCSLLVRMARFARQGLV